MLLHVRLQKIFVNLFNLHFVQGGRSSRLIVHFVHYLKYDPMRVYTIDVNIWLAFIYFIDGLNWMFTIYMYVIVI